MSQHARKWQTAWVGLPLLALAVWAGCNKSEEAVPPAHAAQQVGVEKAARVFVNVTGTAAANVDFRICNSGGAGFHVASGTSTVNYGCGSPCSSSAVNIVNGFGGTFCFNEGQQYTILPDAWNPAHVAGYVLRIKFPVGYNECVPAMTLNYNSNTGLWSLGGLGNLYGVTWSQFSVDSTDPPFTCN